MREFGDVSFRVIIGRPFPERDLAAIRPVSCLYWVTAQVPVSEGPVRFSSILRSSGADLMMLVESGE